MDRISIEIAHNAAVASFEKDHLYRQWVARQGGVYAPVNLALPPNPHLAGTLGRDITTPEGRQLTLVNPAYMTRQVHELGRELYSHRGHITSLRPLRPENAPDAWETKALQAFESGVKEVSEVARLDGAPHLRLMRPMRTDASCLKCHEAQGYKEGDVRGGISVSVPLRDFELIERRYRLYEWSVHGGVWGIGCLSIFGVGAVLRRRQDERDRAQVAAQASASRFRALFENSPMPIWLQDYSSAMLSIREWRKAGVSDLREHLDSRPDRLLALTQAVTVVEVNQASVLAFGAPDRDSMLRDIARCATPDSRMVLRDVICALDKGAVGHRAEVSLRTFQGRPVIFDLTLSVQPGNEALLDRVIVTLVDITERRRVEETLRRERDRAQAYLDTVEAIIVALDSKGRVTLVNRKGCRLLERDEADLIGCDWFELCVPPGEETSRVRALFDASLAAGVWDPEYVENQIRTGSGRLLQIAWHNTVLLDEAGRVCGALASGENVTDRKLLEAKLREAQKMEAIGQLAGGVAHDFNNILAATMLNLDLLRQQPQLTEDMRDMLRELQGEAQRAAEITRQLLMFGRRSVFEYRVLDLNAMLVRMAAMFERLLGERIHVEFARRAVAAYANADEGMISQAVMNICLNARDAMPEGGTISLATDVVRLGEGERGRQGEDRKPGSYVRIIISDTGMGMDEATMNRIFEPFFTTKELGRGSGLGLAAVYGIVAQHGGWVEVESIPGRGAVFRIVLPMFIPSPEQMKGGSGRPR